MIEVVYTMCMFLCLVRGADLPCTMINTTLASGGPFSVDKSCTNVTYVDVTLAGMNAALNISITSLALANAAARTVNISLLRIRLLDGAALVLDSRNNAQISTSNFSIYIVRLVGRNGAVAFTGLFPPHTVILFANATMVADNSSRAPTLSALDKAQPFWAKLILMSDVALNDQSSLILHNVSSIVTLGEMNCSAVTLTGSLSIANASSLVFSSCYLNTTSQAAFSAYALAAVITLRSTWGLDSTTMAASRSACFNTDTASISVTNEGTWYFSRCKCGGFLGPRLTSSTSVSLLSNSSWSFRSCAFHGRSDAFLVEFSSGLIVRLGSQWFFSDCHFLSVGASAFRLRNFPVSLSSSSLWGYTNCSFSGGSTSSFFVSAVGTETRARMVNVDSCSKWNFDDSMFNSTIANAFCLCSACSVANASSWTLNRCSFNSLWSIGFSIAETTVVTHKSSVTLVDCYFSGFVAALSISNGSYDVKSGSVIAIRDSQLEGGWSAFLIALADVVVSMESLWAVSNCSISSRGTLAGTAAVLLGRTPFLDRAHLTLTITDQSNWTFANCTISQFSGRPAIRFASMLLTVSNESYWSMEDCSATTINEAVIVVTDSTLSISASSEMSISRNRFSPTDGKISALSLLASRAEVSRSSMLSIKNSTLGGPITASSDCVIQVLDVSALLFSTVFVVASGPGIVLRCGVTVSGASMLMLRRLSIQTPGADSCLDVGQLTLKDWGVVRVLDNDCYSRTGSAVSFLAGSIDTSSSPATGFPLVVGRCNQINGADQRQLWRDAGILGASILQCGRCDTAVDCFWPLTTPSLITRMQCDIVTPPNEDLKTNPWCPCIADCGGNGAVCLPGPRSNRPSTCRVNRNYDARPALSQTVSMNLTRSSTITRSLTMDAANVLSTSKSALQTATAVSVSVAVLTFGPSGAGMMQRMQAQQALNSCAGASDSSPDFSSSPTQLAIGTDGGTKYVQGTVVGNTLLWISFCLVTALAAKILSLRSPVKNVWDCCCDLRVPGRLYVVYSMLLTPTLMASTLLVGGGPGSGETVLTGLVGFAVCFCAALVVIFQTSQPRFMARPVEIAAEEEKTRLSSLKTMVTGGQYEWADRRGSRARGFVGRWGTLFEAYAPHRQWFCVVETVASAAAGILAGLGLSDTRGSCGLLQVLSVGGGSAFLVALVKLRPYKAPLDGRVALCNAAVTTASAVFGAGGIDTTVLTVAQALINVAAALLILIAVVIEAMMSFEVPRRRDRQLSVGNVGPTASIPVDDRLRALEMILDIICNSKNN